MHNKELWLLRTVTRDLHNIPVRSSASTTAAASSSASSNEKPANGRSHTVLLLTRPELHIHHHHYPLESAILRQSLQPSHSGRPSAWLPFLVGSGVTALGFAAYGTYADRSMAAAAAATVVQPISISGAFARWAPPWRSASMQGNGAIVSAPDMFADGHSSRQPGQQRVGQIPLLPTALSDCDPAASTSASSSGTFVVPSAASGAVSALTMSTPFTRVSISEASAKVAPSVVHLVVTNGEDPAAAANSILGHRSSGSGFVYDERGFVLTNAHVVLEAMSDGGRNALVVTMQDGRVFRGQVLNVDKASDIAIVKIDSPEPLTVAKLGSSQALKVGEWVVAMGSPLMLRQSVTAGIVSCVERKGSELGLKAAGTGYIQTDAAVNQGNSGGPLVNLDGEVIGVNNMKAVAADGVSFAIPIDAVREIVRQLSVNGRVIRPFVGISMVEVSNGGLKQLVQRLPGLPLQHVQSAVIIQKVVDGSPARAAGLEPEDVIVSVAGEPNLSMSQMIEQFTHSIGRPVEVKVIRRRNSGSSSSSSGGSSTSEEDYSLLTKSITPVEAPIP